MFRVGVTAFVFLFLCCFTPFSRCTLPLKRFGVSVLLYNRLGFLCDARRMDGWMDGGMEKEIGCKMIILAGKCDIGGS